MKNLSIIACFLLFISCAKEKSENVNQDSIYAIYELFYKKHEDKTTARATFRFGGPSGTLLELSSPAFCNFNNDDLLYNAILGVHEKEYSGLVSNGSYVYEDLDDNVFTNMTPSIKEVSFPVLESIDSEKSFTFNWVGDALSQNESMILTIDGTMQSNFEVFSASNIGDTQIILESNKLKKLGLGTAQCTLVRMTTIDKVDQGTSKGGRVAVWYSTKQSVTIK